MVLPSLPKSAESRNQGGSGRAERGRRWPVPPGGWAAGLTDRGLLTIGVWFRREFEGGAGFLWTVVLYGLGAALYLSLPSEPDLPALVVLAILLTSLSFWLRRRGRAARGLVALAALACGALAADLQSRRVAAPRLDHERTVEVAGWIADAETTQRNGRRFVIRVQKMTARGLAADRQPDQIAVTARGKGRDLAVGTGVSFLARLRPPEGPTRPSGYDFARRAWFEGRGASGYVLGKVSQADLGDAPLATRIAAPLSRLRTAVADRIRMVIPGENGAIAAALTVGEARAVPEEANVAMRYSGLYHIVSISGLHMSLVAGGVLVTLRFLLALFPNLAMRHDIRKISAAGAVIAASFYLLLSGSSVATVRSWVMFCVALLAILTDRPAINMHTVAISAALILIFDPSSVIEPGFLMSFLAVMCLVATFQAWPERPEPGSGDKSRRLVMQGLLWLLAACVTSMVAGLATAPVVIAEFNRISPYSVLANVVVLPIVGLVIMPMAIASLVLMPFGLDQIPLHILGGGIDVMMAWARWVAGLPGGAGLVGAVQPLVEPLAIGGLLWLALWRTPVRFVGVMPLLVAFLLGGQGRTGDILVSDDGRTVAVRERGGLALVGVKENAFAANTWLLADRDPRVSKSPDLAGGWACDALGCAILSPTLNHTEKDPKSNRSPTQFDYVVQVNDPRAFEEECRPDRIVITRLQAPPACADRAGLLIDRDRLARTGNVAIRFRDGHADLTASLPPFDRPWTPARPAAAMVPDRLPPKAPSLPPLVNPVQPPEERGETAEDAALSGGASEAEP